jgi:preprotein translocase subunit YajC
MTYLSLFFLQAAATGAPTGLAPFFPLLFALIIAVFFIIPGYMKQRKQTAFLKALGVGATIYTNSGIIGKIVSLDDREVTLQIDEKTKMRIIRSTIGGVYEK